MKARKKHKNQMMTEGRISSSLLFFAIPLLIGNLFQQLYNTVDSVIVGNYIGKEALAAVGSSNSLINLIIGLFMGIAVGAGVLISQYYGARDREKMQWAVHTAIALSLLGGILLTISGIVLSPVILRMMGTPEEVMADSVTYLRIFFLGSIFNIVYNMGAGILRGVGDSKRPLYYLCAASVVNIVLDFAFVVWFGMGVEGVAIATIIAQGVSAALILFSLANDDDIYRMRVKEIRIDVRMMKRILMIGIPSGIQNCVISFSNVVVQANINAFGPDAMAGCSSYMKVDGFVILPIMSFGMAAMTFTGQNIGAKKLDRVKRGILSAISISLIYTAIVSVLLYLYGYYILGIFSPDPQVNAYGVYMLRLLIPFYWALAIVQVLTGTFRGAGKATESMLMMVGSLVGVRLAWIQIMIVRIPELKTVLLGYPVSWMAALAAAILYSWKGNWLKRPDSD